MSLQKQITGRLRQYIKSYIFFDDEDKKIWLKRIEILPPEYALFLVELFEESPEEVKRIHENIKNKEEILEKQDEVGWGKLLEKERERLNFLIQKE